MKLVLLAGVALNFGGAAKLLASAATVPPPSAGVPPDYQQLKLFTGGTAAVFGSLYLYLFVEPGSVVPFLVFGAALKTWAFVLSLGLFLKGRLPRRALMEFGVANLAVAALFWISIATV